jgi:lauroyl/myristoyl acyltransferase
MINKRPIDYSWEYKRFKRSLPINQNPYLGI